MSFLRAFAALLMTLVPLSPALAGRCSDAADRYLKELHDLEVDANRQAHSMIQSFQALFTIQGAHSPAVLGINNTMSMELTECMRILRRRMLAIDSVLAQDVVDCQDLHTMIEGQALKRRFEFELGRMQSLLVIMANVYANLRQMEHEEDPDQILRGAEGTVRAALRLELLEREMYRSFGRPIPTYGY